MQIISHLKPASEMYQNIIIACLRLRKKVAVNQFITG